MDVDFEFVTDVTNSDCPLAGLPSGTTVKIYIIFANDASKAAASDTLTIVVP